MLLTSPSMFSHWVFFSSARSSKPRRNKKTHPLDSQKASTSILSLFLTYCYYLLQIHLLFRCYIGIYLVSLFDLLYIKACEMEVHSPVIAKRLWNVLRITFFMIRKGLISKRKLIMDMNLMMKKGKLLRKSLANLMSSHHHHSRSVARGGFGLQEYEFSCSNSPNPVFFQVPKRKHHFNFPCINPPQVIEDQPQLEAVEGEELKAVVLVPKTPEYTFNFRLDASDYLSPGEKRSPLVSPFSVRISNYSSDDENEEGGHSQVDDQAEDFIRRFYEQLRMQSRMQLLEYQEI